MSDSTFDTIIDNAWREFAERLAARLPDLTGDQFIEIAHQDDHGYRPLVVFTMTRSGRLRGTIDSTALPSTGHDRWLAHHRLLSALGWRLLTRRSQHIAETGRRSSRRLADLTVRGLRQVWGFEHPVFVTVHDPFVGGTTTVTASGGRRLSAVADVESHGTPAPAGVDGMGAAMIPVDDRHLLEAARDALSAILGREIIIEDGAIEVRSTDAVPWRVFACPHGPSLILTTTLTHRLTDPAALGALLAEHSSSWSEISFPVNNDHVYAQRIVDGAAFHPQNLAIALCMWRRFLDEAADEFMARLNAGGPGAHACAHNTVPVGLQTLFELSHTETLTPDRVAHLTNGKIERLREYLQVCHNLVADARSHWAAMPLNAPMDDAEQLRKVVEFYQFFVDLIEQAIERTIARGA